MAKETKPTIESEIAAFMEGARKYGRVGALAVLLGWISSQSSGRRAARRLINLVDLGRERAMMELGRAITWTQREYDDARYAVLTSLAMLCVAGLCCIGVSAFIPDLLWKALVIDSMVAFVFYLLHDFWANRIMPLLIIGVAKGFITGVTANDLRGMRSVLTFLMRGPQRGVGEGLSWVNQLWRYCGMAIFWFSVGSQYLIWTPLAPVKELLFASVTCIPIFFLGTTVWNPKQRGMEISWVLWAALAMLVDVAVLAVFKHELYQPIVEGDLTARQVMMGVLFAEAIGLIVLVVLIRRPSRVVLVSGAAGTVAVSEGTGHRWPGDRMNRQPRPTHPMIKIAAVVGVLFVFVAVTGTAIHLSAKHHPEWFTGKKVEQQK